MFDLTAIDDCERLDVYLSGVLNISRTKAAAYIKKGCVKSVPDTKLKPSMKVSAGQKFLAEIPESPNLKGLPAEDVAFDVVYEDEYLLVINKPSGLVVHPAPGNWSHTLVNGLVYRYPDMRKLEERMRPGIVHRLDSPTSGLMIAARTQEMTLALQKMFTERKVTKTYLALVHGTPPKHEGILSGPIDRDPNTPMKMAVVEGGRPSLTGYRVLWSRRGHSLVECRLFTGRTHQIRVHMSALGCPLVGDTMYGAERYGDEFTGRIYLHSWRLEFEHPATGKAMKFLQIVPHDFRGMIARVKLGA
ncbi:MAG: RluA family pseudouridine synthase [Synergistaceae bacterium]|nr:RluA family pseudouridine synthase [Synergistaceae bacterium]